jgi:hypothetical protein
MTLMKVLIPILTAALALGTGCGGGASASAPAAAVAGPSTYAMKASLQGLLAPGASIGSIDLTLTLPPGVTVPADGNGQALDGVVTPSGAGAGSLAVARFTPADASQRARIRILLINAKGIPPGECVTVQCDVAAGSTPALSEFSWSALAVTDGDSKTLRGLSAVLGQ